MIRRPATRIELKMEEDIHEYEEMKEAMKKHGFSKVEPGLQNYKKTIFNNAAISKHRNVFGGDLNFSGSSGNEGSFNMAMGRQMLFGAPGASFGNASGGSGFLPFQMNEILSKESQDEEDEFIEVERRHRNDFED